MSDLVLSMSRAPSGARLVEGSLAELSSARAAARDESLRAASHRAGYEEALAGAAKTLESAASQLDELRAGMTESLAETAAQLAVEMLQELLRVELVAQNYDIVGIVRSTIAEAGSHPGAMAIHVHPEDAAKLTQVPFRTGTTIEADPAVRRGDVQLHTNQGQLVRDLDACVASIRERILAEVTSC